MNQIETLFSQYNHFLKKMENLKIVHTLKYRSIVVWLLLVCFNSLVSAHEFWIEPNQYVVEPNHQVDAMLLVGQMMRGTEYPYLSHNFHAFTITTKNGKRDVSAMEGDIPALSYQAKVAGLHAINYHSKTKKVTYNNWDEFLRYLAYEGLDKMATVHLVRGLPESDFKESYIRFAKALVQVGSVTEQDQDVASGTAFELVANSNPYTAKLKSIVVTLLRSGSPVVERQISIFHYDGEVSRSLVKTDNKGQAVIDISKGGSFLLNAVDLLPVDDDEVVWRSHWASLSFGLPIDSQP